MAYVPTSADDDEEKRRAAAGNAPGSFGDTTPTSTPTKTNFVNVSDYLDKNPNASEHLGDLASSKLASQRDETLGAVNQAKTQFGQDVQAGGMTQDNALLSSAFSSPETFTQDPENVAKFHALRDASYKGPSSLETTDVFAPTQSKVSALTEAGKSLGTEAGRTNLVEGLSAHPTHGKSSLNQLLLQGNPAASQKMTDTAATFKGVDDQWQQFIQDAPNQVSQTRATTDATRNATRAGLEDAEQNFMTGLNAKTAAATNAHNAFNTNYTNLNNKLNNGPVNLSQKELDDLGMSGASPYLSKLNSFNLDLNRWGNPVPLSSYVTPGQADSNIPTLGNTANAADYSREAALQQLSGMDLGLADTPESPYVANGKLPTADYMGAFNAAGTRLQGQEKDILANPNDYYPLSAGVPTDDFWSKFYPAKSHSNAEGYYTNPDANATPVEGYQFTPAPQGWNPSQPPPYPAPTSNPPPQLIQPKWNQYTGKWEGAQLQPNNPPPPTGGTRVTF